MKTPSHSLCISRALSIVLVLTLAFQYTFATDKEDLRLLYSYIDMQPAIDAAHEQRIAQWEKQLETTSSRYMLYDSLFQACRSYNFERALHYVDLLQKEALRIGSPDAVAHAQIQRAFAYLSGGLFKECYDILENMDTVHISPHIRADYCVTYARLLYDMADYNHVDMAQTYIEQGNALIKGALDIYTPSDTADYWSCMAMLDEHHAIHDRAIQRFAKALEDSRIDEHQKAIFYSTMAYMYNLSGMTVEQQHFDILAAIADIKSSTKETTAMRHVAEMLYKEGDVANAAKCIRYAQADAKFYNARHRQVEISQILPIIEKQYNDSMQKTKRSIILLATLAIVLFVITFGVLLLLVRRNRAIRAARQTIEDMNQSLLVANKVKEEYIGNFLCWQSDFIDEVEKYEKNVRSAAVQRRYQDLMTVPAKVDASRRRDEFYKRLDEMLLALFPTFVEDFNALLRSDAKMELKPGELLNTDMRIFALMRLGITYNEIIAQVLGYSVNTIYTYKTKVKNRSDLSTRDFDERIMAIPSFSRT